LNLGPLLIRSGTGAVNAPVKEIRDEPGEVMKREGDEPKGQTLRSSLRTGGEDAPEVASAFRYTPSFPKWAGTGDRVAPEIGKTGICNAPRDWVSVGKYDF